MSEVALIINVSPDEYTVPLGIRGVYCVPKAVDGEFALLILRDVPELQDIGGMQRVRREAVLAMDTAKDIMAYGQVDMTKKGLLICSAQPDEPKYLLKAEREERDFLNKHKPRIEYEKDSETGTLQAVNKQEDRAGVVQQKTELSNAVVEARARFADECRKLVKPNEVAKAMKGLLQEDQRLVALADQLYANEMSRKEIGANHQSACRRLGQERPWCYSPREMEDCVACGVKVNKGVAICSHCGAVLDDKKARHFKVGPYKTQPQPAVTA